jgi:hypothetical protein
LSIYEVLITATDATNNSVPISVEMALLAGCALAACMICIVIVFNWSRRLQIQGHLRSTLVSGYARIEEERFLNELDNKAWDGPLNPTQNPFPREAGEYDLFPSIWLMDDQAKNKYLYVPDEFVETTIPEGMTKAEVEKLKAIEKKRRQEWVDAKIAVDKFKEWAAKERNIYNSMLDEKYKKAREIAEKQVPKAMDTSILGGGFQFILEFSTVIVIIFSVIVLGVIGIMEGREIATILAAIAGYVLGKASGWAPSGEGNKKSESEGITPKK